MSKQYWLMKSEPDTFSIDDLIKAKNQTTAWEGVRNFQARNHMRSMQVGDLAFFYHSSCEIPSIVGTMEIVRAAHADMTAFDPTSDYYDPKSTPEHPRWYMVDVQYKKKLKTPITLTELRNHPALTGFTLLKRGNRLSVMSVSEQQWQTILAIPKRQ